MKDINELINESINEAREEVYGVAFSGFEDKEGSPITVTISVPREYAKDFEKYLDKEGGNSIAHASGRTNDYELEY